MIVRSLTLAVGFFLVVRSSIFIRKVIDNFRVGVDRSGIEKFRGIVSDKSTYPVIPRSGTNSTDCANFGCTQKRMPLLAIARHAGLGYCSANFVGTKQARSGTSLAVAEITAETISTGIERLRQGK